jgi:hypothetical protein
VVKIKKTPPLLRVWKKKYLLPFESGSKPKKIPR